MMPVIFNCVWLHCLCCLHVSFIFACSFGSLRVGACGCLDWLYSLRFVASREQQVQREYGLVVAVVVEVVAGVIVDVAS